MAMFYMPAKVYEESEAVKNHAADIAKFGKKALIVTGRRSAFANGSYDDIAAALDSVGVDHVVFNEVEENPSVKTIMKARDFGIAEGVDFVILLSVQAGRGQQYTADRGHSDDLWHRLGGHSGIRTDRHR